MSADLWVITFVHDPLPQSDAALVTRVGIGCEQTARDLFARARASMQEQRWAAVSLRIDKAPLIRSLDETERAEQIVRSLVAH